LFVIKQEDNLFSVVAAKNYERKVLPVPLEPMLSYKLGITTQDFFIFFMDLKKGTLLTTRCLWHCCEELWKKDNDTKETIDLILLQIHLSI
jgi:hypothetical protein